MEIAVAASQGEILGFRSPAMLPSDDVFDMKSNDGRSRLRQTAVFANIPGSVSD
jgi:hypothetical protein